MVRISNGGKFHEIEPTEVFEVISYPFSDEWKYNVRFREPHSVEKDNDCVWYVNGEGL
jgi:hypothetical protein